ncbi:hypothetical protein [Dongia sp.]|uniref:hypothetical protein n=1 Tax=Dongia sp. TaxID=1977262 RepID=UPI0037538CC4
MLGVTRMVSKLAWIPLVAYLAAGCVDMSPEAANLRLQSQMGWNAEKELQLKQQMEAIDLFFDSLGLDHSARSYFAGYFTDGGF